MKLPIIRESYFINIIILIFALFTSWFGLLFGIAHLIETKINNLELNDVFGAFISIFLCVLGVISLGVAVASIRGILYKLKKKN